MEDMASTRGSEAIPNDIKQSHGLASYGQTGLAKCHGSPFDICKAGLPLGVDSWSTAVTTTIRQQFPIVVPSRSQTFF